MGDISNLEAIVIGGSAGALSALELILPAVPRDCRAALVVVLHVLASRPSLLPEVLGARCALPVKEAEDKEPVSPGRVYVAPPGYHLLIERNRAFALSVDPPVHYSRPAIDVLFESAAEVFGAHLAGVLLSGANEDGAAGLAAIKARGGLTMVQSPEDAEARAMPTAALAAVRVDHLLPAAGLAALLGRVAATAGHGKEAR
jgi:two-component system, chemotaxis family, protein-glutamate methylesterase/glutaminase